MDDFLQQNGQLPQDMATPFAMEQMRRDLEAYQIPSHRSGLPGWAAEFDPAEQARMEATFQAPKVGGFVPAGFSPSEFQRFHQMERNGLAKSVSPLSQTPTTMSGYQRPCGAGMGYGMGGMGMMGSSFRPISIAQRPADSTTQGKGKGRMVELDDQNWEQQFAQIDAEGEQILDAQANDAIESELNNIDRSVSETLFGDFENIWRGIQAETLDARQMVDDDILGLHGPSDDWKWEGFDTRLDDPLSYNGPIDPQLGSYLFEDDNLFRAVGDPFSEGQKIMLEGGNLSLAALAFEAAVQRDPQHVAAWTALGSAQAQNEKESPAIRALEQALKLDPDNLEALMGLAISYTNEGYDSTAYRTLERWLATKYPQIISPSELSTDADLGFTDRHLLHERVTSLFIRAAQISPSGPLLDPDVQVGLGVLFYGAEEYEKAVDCFEAALASTETGTVNSDSSVHLLWNRLGATLANSGRSEEAIAAYEKALNLRQNFVRARYNLGVSCINIGCLEEAAQHLLGALSMHDVVAREGRDRMREVVGAGDEDMQRVELAMQMNQSTNLYDTLKRVFNQMGRRDLSEKVVAGMDVEQFRHMFDF